ncbi:MAG TPA: M1 family peptidase, partial [Thermoanaerobaculia bacterium]
PGGDIYDKGSYVLHALRNLIGDEAFFRAVRRLVYGTEDPRPGNFAPRFADTAELIGIVNDVTGRDFGWFFDVYVRSAALPELVVARDDAGLALSWKTGGDRPFPMPVEVRVANRIETVPMTDGRGRVALAAHETYTIDPHSKLLRHEPNIEAFRKWEEEQRKRQQRR